MLATDEDDLDVKAEDLAAIERVVHAQLLTELRPIEQTLHGFATQITLLSDQISRLTTNVDALSSVVADLGKTVVRHDERLATIDDRITARFWEQTLKAIGASAAVTGVVVAVVNHFT